MSQELAKPSIGTEPQALLGSSTTNTEIVSLANPIYNGKNQDISFEDIESAIVKDQPGVVDLVKRWVSSDVKGQTESNAAGRTALHLAASTNNTQVAEVLLQAGSDPSSLDDEDNTVLHVLCSVAGKDITNFAEMIIVKMPEIDTINAERFTALHLAAGFGHLATVKLLLDRGADMGCKDMEGATPVHIACEAGHTEIYCEFRKRNRECAFLKGNKNETPLHSACRNGHYDMAKTILEGKVKPDPNAENKHGETPLHKACSNGSVPIAELLLKHDADINPKTRYKKTPFHVASFFAHSELALFLLEKGAAVTPEAFRAILNEGYKTIAKAVLESEQWPVALRGVYTIQGRKTTAFRELVIKMPGLARLVLNKCTVPNDRNRDDDKFAVLYNYEFIEDTCGPAPVAVGCEETDGLEMMKLSTTRDDEKNYGCSYEEIEERDCHPGWGPKTFSKTNHPLQIMVDQEHLNLLNHPVVGSLLHYKWQKFGLISYLINLFSYCIFLLFLTIFALVVPHPQKEQCAIRNFSNTTEAACPDTSVELYGFLIFASIVVLGLGSIRLGFELIQLFLRFPNYFKDFTNWLEVSLYVCSIIFVVVHATDCFCVLNWQWQVGVAAVFLGWMVLILFLAKLPHMGIFVLIFFKICISFVKMIVLTAILIFAFGVVFLMVFTDETVVRSPFAHLGHSLVKTMTMTIGEFDYNDNFRLSPSGEADTLTEIPYPEISYIMWIIFLVLMPIILMNMLTSLAVGDTDKVRKDAQLSKLALQVEQVLSTEEIIHFFSRCLPWKLKMKAYRKILPNVPVTKWRKKLSFLFWEGVQYDSIGVIKRLLNSSKDKDEEILEQTQNIATQVKKMKKSFQTFKDSEILRSTEVATRTAELASEVEEMKNALRKVQDVLEEIMRRSS